MWPTWCLFSSFFKALAISVSTESRINSRSTAKKLTVSSRGLLTCTADPGATLPQIINPISQSATIVPLFAAVARIICNKCKTIHLSNLIQKIGWCAAKKHEKGWQFLWGLGTVNRTIPKNMILLLNRIIRKVATIWTVTSALGLYDNRSSIPAQFQYLHSRKKRNSGQGIQHWYYQIKIASSMTVIALKRANSPISQAQWTRFPTGTMFPHRTCMNQVLNKKPMNRNRRWSREMRDPIQFSKVEQQMELSLPLAVYKPRKIQWIL